MVCVNSIWMCGNYFQFQAPYKVKISILRLVKKNIEKYCMKIKKRKEKILSFYTLL